MEVYLSPFKTAIWFICDDQMIGYTVYVDKRIFGPSVDRIRKDCTPLDAEETYHWLRAWNLLKWKDVETGGEKGGGERKLCLNLH